MKTMLATLFLLSFTASSVHAQQDEINTAEGTLTLTPILHSTMVLEFKGKMEGVDAKEIWVIANAERKHWSTTQTRQLKFVYVTGMSISSLTIPNIPV